MDIINYIFALYFISLIVLAVFYYHFDKHTTTQNMPMDFADKRVLSIIIISPIINTMAAIFAICIYARIEFQYFFFKKKNLYKCWIIKEYAKVEVGMIKEMGAESFIKHRESNLKALINAWGVKSIKK